MAENQTYNDPFQSLSEHDPRDDVPFLKDPYKEDNYFSLDPHNVKVTPKTEDTYLFPNLVCEQIKKQVSNIITMKPYEYAANGRKKYAVRELDIKNCDNEELYGQKGLFAITDLPIYTVLGLYAGYYLDDVKDFEHLYNKMNPVLCDRYMHACAIEGHPAICGYMAGNYMSYINDWRPMGHCPDDDLSAVKEKRHKVTSLLCESAGYKFIAIVTTDSIWENDEIFTDYGENYWVREAYIRESILGLKEN